MKIALITDTHFGARSDSQPFDQYFKKFYEEVFFPTLKSRDITHIIHLGDTFDRRKYINYQTLKSCREYFFDRLKILDIKCLMLAGNHDTYFKNTNDVNSPDLLLKDYDNIEVLDDPSNVVFSDTNFCMIPWICADNFKQTMEVIEQSSADICLGHLELAGFAMFKGQENQDGMDPTVFKNFKFVGSGHFHHKSTKGNIHYLGNPYHMFWYDYEDDRGFHILDTETLDLEFVKNPNTIFAKYYYDDEKEDPLKFDAEQFRSKLVKVIVINKKDFYKFDKFVDNIYKVNPLELKIVEDFSEFETEALDETIDLEDTMTLLSNYVESIETDVDKEKLKTILKTLYVEAQHYEEV
jgi:DNA repair exonuclease SbcCD nuclease subunit